MRLVALLFSAVLFLCVGCFSQQQPAPSQPQACREPEQKQFDFWVGEWQLSWPDPKQGGTLHGTNSIRRTLDGCVVQENFSGGDAGPLRGMSVSTYDARASKWKQTWVDNQGGYLDFVGEFQDGQMVLSREGMTPDGRPVRQRMVYTNITANEFDWKWERSLDNGKTWQVMWPIHYKRSGS
jgi:hypothetical protein